MLGDREGHVGGVAAHQRRLVRGRHHDHGAGQAGGAEIVLQEFLHLAAALAHEADHRHVGGGVAGEHRQQHRLANTGAGEDAHPLAGAHGQEGVDAPDPEVQRSADPGAGMGRGRVGA